jgi:hypothetical protein
LKGMLIKGAKVYSSRGICFVQFKVTFKGVLNKRRESAKFAEMAYHYIYSYV